MLGSTLCTLVNVLFAEPVLHVLYDPECTLLSVTLEARVSRAAEAGRANIEDIDAVRDAVMASRKPGQTGRYFIEG